MRNALILTGVWLGILVTAYAIVFWDQGIDRPLPISVLEQAAVTTTSEYVQPDGLFSVSIPAGWAVVEEASYVRLTDPDDSISVWLVAVSAADVETAVEQAIDTTGAGMLTMISTQPIASGPWGGETTAITYVSDSDDGQLRARLQRSEDWTVVLFAQGSEGELDALAQDLDWLWTELTIPADEVVVL